MRWLRVSALRLSGLFSKGRHETELSAELDSHLQLHIDDNLRAGMSQAEARRHALLSLGGLESTKEACRDRNTIPYLENLFQDLRFSLRQLQKNAAFTCTAVLMLALGMSASVAIFAFVDAVLIKPLPYQNSKRLVGVYEHTAKCLNCNLSYLDYLDWKNLNHTFSSFAAYNNQRFMVDTHAGTVAALGARVSDSFFSTLGITPILGRVFYPGDDSPAVPRTVVLSYACWQTRYGGRKNVQGQAATLDGIVYTVIGVLPKDFHFAPSGPAEFWTNMNVVGSCEKRRSCHNLFGVARLKDGASVDTAQADTAVIAEQLAKQYPGSNLGQGARVVQLSEVIVGANRLLVLFLLGGAGLLLLIACVNIASLLLVRSESRKRELAVRTALGASQSRLVRQFITEGLVLVIVGSSVGLLAGYWAMHLLIKLIPAFMLAYMPYLDGLGYNWRVLSFAGAIAVGAGVLFSATPSFCASFSGLNDTLAQGSRGSAGVTWRRLGSKLVVFELAAAMVLLVGAGLLGKSLYRLLQVEVGMLPEHLATLQIAAPKTGYESKERQVALQRRIADRISQIPGVKSVGMCSQLPVSYNGNTDWIRFVGKPYHGEHNDVNQRDVSAAYFTTVKAKLYRGRFFRENEDSSKPSVIIINQALARMYFPGEDPVGKKVGNLDLAPSSLREIVGVVDDIREGPLDEGMLPTEYLPFNQDPDRYFALVVRTLQDESSVLPAISAAVHNIDSAIVTIQPSTMTNVIHDAPSTYLHRSTAWLVAAFAAAALLLGVVGLYGVVAYSVGQRTREIGVRMALGAQPMAVYRLILQEAGWLVALGIGFGLLCSVGVASLIGKLLFDTPAWDVQTLSAVAIVLAVSALLASYLPARRAASVNPVNALRAE